MLKCQFFDEDGGEETVEYQVICGESERPYGIRVSRSKDGILQDTAEAKERYFTRAETDRVMELLCQNQVTPCTLCDLI